MLGFVVVICLFVYFPDRSQYIALAGLEVGHAGLELAVLLALSSQSSKFTELTKPLPPACGD